MKRIISTVLTLVFLISVAACRGNFGQVDLKKPISIPENGIIDKSILDEIKNENAIATFIGKYGDIEYEWIIFGSELNETRNVNLYVEINKTENGIGIKFAEKDDLGFNAMLSVHLNEKWTSDSAIAYVNGNAVYNVSLTGSKNTILNISVNKIFSECEILPKSDYNNNADTSVKPDNSNSNVSEDIESVSDITISDTVFESDSFCESSEASSEQSDYSSTSETKPDDKEENRKKQYTCTISIECSTILNNLSRLDPEKLEIIPSNGVILAPTTVTFYEGESVFDALQRVCKEKGIHLESSITPMYNSAYIDGINNLYEFDCGSLSGWAYRVNGWYPNYSCSRYVLTKGDVVEFRYSCDLGKDIGGGWFGK